MPYKARYNEYRSLGIEIEAFTRSTMLLEDNLRRAGIDALGESYNHRTRSYWKLTTDASLRSSRRGGQAVEVVSPVLDGSRASFEELKTVMRVIRETDGYVNRSTGLHVHWGARDLTGKQVRNLLAFYHKFEPVIDGLVAPSRRNNNSYCGGLELSRYGESSENMEWIHNLDRSGRRSTREVTHNYAGMYGRFRKINLESFGRYGTIEFRQHQGTLNATRAWNWMMFTNIILTKAQYAVRAVKTSKTTVGELIRGLRIADHHIRDYPADEKAKLEQIRDWVKERHSHFGTGDS